MLVQEIMARNVACCCPEDTLAAAAMKMWDHDCGIVPVCTDGQKVNGVITDRDICMATVTKDRKASEISVQDVMSRELQVCRLNDDILDALKMMSEKQIHRLPVVDEGGNLRGILSLNDIDLAAKPQRPRKTSNESFLSYDEVMNAHKEICRHRPLHVTRTAA